MTTPPVPQPAETVSDRFLKLITPLRRKPESEPVEDQAKAAKKKKRRTPEVVEDEDYLEMLWRMVRALEARAANNPEIIIQMIALDERLAEACNVAIAISAERFAIDPKLGASAGEIARLMGISKQSVSERRQRGREVMERRIAASGATKFSEAARERAAIRAAAEHAAQAMPEYQARHLKVVGL